MDYIHYQVEDFVDDLFFIKWVKDPDDDTHTFWKKWLQSHPEKLTTIEEARRIVTFLSFEAYHPTEDEKQEVRGNIRQMLNAQQQSPSLRKLQQTERFSKNWRKIAATVAFLLAAAWLVWYVIRDSQVQKHTTTYASVQEIILPDSSVVILNANSTLSYKKNWNENTSREVWLQGEAFFRILEKAGRGDAHFIVHTHNLDVEVLGTEFNVNSRHGDTKVVLNSGKVKLNGKDKKGQEQELLMEPGDLVLLTKEHELIRRQVNPVSYSSWKDNRLFFDGHTIREIKQLLEDNYGYKVKIADSILLDMVFTGSCPSDHLGILFTALEETFEIDISVEGNTIIIQKNSNTYH